MSDKVEVKALREFRMNGSARKVGGRTFEMPKAAAERAERRGQVEILTDEEEDDQGEGEEEGAEDSDPGGVTFDELAERDPAELTRDQLFALLALEVESDKPDHYELGKYLGPLMDAVPSTKDERIDAAKRFLDG